MIELSEYLAEASLRSAQFSGAFSAPCWLHGDRRSVRHLIEHGIAFIRSNAVAIFLALVALIALSSNHATAALEFSRSAIGEGQWWRVFTGHLTHWSADHLAWDLLMFVVVGTALESRDRARYLFLLAVSALTVSAVVFWLQPEITEYRGLSGIDSALFVALGIRTLLDARHDRQAAPQRSKWLSTAALLLLLAFIAKTMHDYITGDTLMVDSAAAGFIPLALAHVAGAFAAVSLAAFEIWPIRRASFAVRR